MTEVKKDSFFNQYGKPFLVGSLQGSIASATIQPIDTVKVVIQNRREAAGKGVAMTSPTALLRKIINESALYKGFNSAILRQFVYCGIRLGLLNRLKI